MVEVLILAALIIGVRAVYLRIFRGKEEAKGFVEKSTNEVNQVMGCMALIGLLLVIMFILAVS